MSMKVVEDRANGIWPNDPRLHLALEAARAGIYEADLVTGKNVWSDEIWMLYGLAPGSVEPSTEAFLATVDPSQREGLIARIGQAIKSASVFEAEWRVHLPDTERWLMCRGSPLPWVGPGPERYVGIVLDVTPRVLAERALLAQQASLKHVLKAIPQLVAWVGPDLRYKFVNETYARSFGQPTESFIGCTVEEKVGAEAFARAAPQVARVLAGETVQFDNDVLFADGRLHSLRMNFVPEGDGYIAIIADITQELAIERERERLRAQLELIGRQQVAQQVIAAVAHDLNQPLHAAATYCEALRRMLSNGYAAPLVAETAGRALAELGRAGVVLQSLMYSAIQPETLTTMEVTDLNAVAAAALRRFRDERRPERLCIAEDYGAGPLLSELNAMAIDRVVHNFLNNACAAVGCRHCRDGKVHIRISTARVDGEAWLCVEDDGPGVPDAVSAHLFEPQPASEAMSGRGVGLAIARRVIELHNGRIWHQVSSTGGAHFCIALPLAT